MSEIADVRQEKTYRRGLILGLTIAEVMILLIFVLLMALAASLQKRDQKIAALDNGGASRLEQSRRKAGKRFNQSISHSRPSVDRQRRSCDGPSRCGRRNIEIGSSPKGRGHSSAVRRPDDRPGRSNGGRNGNSQ